MNTAVEFIGYGAIAPAVVAIVVCALSRWLLSDDVGSRYAGGLAFGAAFVSGYVLLPDWAALVPDRHWHWLPYLAAIAAILGPIGLAEGVRPAERWLLGVMLAIAAGCLLVPSWTSLDPRWAYIAIFAGYGCLSAVALDALAPHVQRMSMPIALVTASAVTTVSAGIFVSLKFGQLSGIATAAVAGCTVASFRHKDPLWFRSLIPAFAVVVGGLAFVTAIEPDPTMFALLLVPAAPLALATCVWGPMSRLQGFKAAAVDLVIVLVPMAAAVIWIVAAQEAETGDY